MDRGVCKHKINSPIDGRSSSYNNGSNKQQLQVKRMRKTRSTVKFIARHRALLHHNLPKTRIKLQLRQPKVAKTEAATTDNTGDQRYIPA